jgi:hypothetical protein
MQLFFSSVASNLKLMESDEFVANGGRDNGSRVTTGKMQY